MGAWLTATLCFRYYVVTRCLWVRVYDLCPNMLLSRRACSGSAGAATAVDVAVAVVPTRNMKLITTGSSRWYKFMGWLYLDARTTSVFNSKSDCSLADPTTTCRRSCAFSNYTTRTINTQTLHTSGTMSLRTPMFLSLNQNVRLSSSKGSDYRLAAPANRWRTTKIWFCIDSR